MNNIFLIVLLFLLKSNFIYSHFQAKTFTNSGQIKSENAVIIAEEKFENKGEVIGRKSINIECGNITGNGKIIGSKIKIFAKEFNFKGIIDCSQECIITTAKKINSAIFRKRNKGKFIFKVEPNLELPSKIKILEERKNFKGPLTQYWQECLNIFRDNVNQNTSICRICVQFNIDEHSQVTKTWEKLKTKINDILWFMKFPRSSFDKKNLLDHINELPFDEIQKDKNIITKVNIKIVKTSDIIGKIEDNCDYSKIILTYFVLFDYNNSILQNIFTTINPSAREALNLHYMALKKLQNNNVICDGYFYIYNEF